LTPPSRREPEPLVEEPQSAEPEEEANDAIHIEEAAAEEIKDVQVYKLQNTYIIKTEKIKTIT
jgi:hypothetical protein